MDWKKLLDPLKRLNPAGNPANPRPGGPHNPAFFKHSKVFVFQEKHYI